MVVRRGRETQYLMHRFQRAKILTGEDRRRGSAGDEEAGSEVRRWKMSIS